MMKLTGRTRLRPQKRWFQKSLLVLQVEETGTRPELMGGYVESFDFTQWRDARVEDLSL